MPDTDPTRPGQPPRTPPTPCANCEALQAEVNRLQILADRLQHLLDERDRVAESIPAGTFTVRSPILKPDDL